MKSSNRLQYLLLLENVLLMYAITLVSANFCVTKLSMKRQLIPIITIHAMVQKQETWQNRYALLTWTNTPVSRSAKVRRSRTSIFHTLIVLSHEAVYNTPLLIATAVTGPVCPRKACPISLVYSSTQKFFSNTSKFTRLANPPLSAVKSRGRSLLGEEGSIQKVRIFEGKTRGFPFLLFAFRRRFVRVSRDAVVWKKCSGSFETLMMMIDKKSMMAWSHQKCTKI